MIAVLQFDSASVALLNRLLAEGRLPNLAAFAGSGRRLELATPAEDFAAGAVHTLYSGVELADHGIFYPFQWDAAAQRIRLATSIEAPPAVWERLAGQGLRTLAIDPYESRPPQESAGVLACGVGFTDRVVLPSWSLPRIEGRRLRRELGRAPDATEVFGRPSAERLLALRRVLLDAPGRVAGAATRLLRRESFDLAWITFAASHVAGHQFWDLSQVDVTGLAASERRALTAALGDVYAAVDEGIGRVLEALPAGSDVIVTSAVGMDVNTSHADLLPEMLAAVLRGGPAAEREADGSIWGLRASVPASWRARVAQAIPDWAALELTARLELRGTDWARTRAFAHPADNQGYVRLNLRGREREGIVDPRETDALCEEIAAGLVSFRDANGVPAVTEVVRVQAAYAGNRTQRLPDLSVRWNGRPATGAVELRSEEFGTVARRGGGSGRSGNHTAGDAWAIVAAGSSAHADPARPPRLADVVATVCEVTGADRAGIGGRPLLAPAGAQPDEAGRTRSRANPRPVAT